MHPRGSTRQLLTVGLPSLAFGGLLHAFLFRILAARLSPDEPNAPLLVNPLTKPTFVLLGGIFVAAFMIRLLSRSLASPRPKSRRVLLLGVAYGVAATWATLSAFYVLISAYASVTEGRWAAPLVFIYILMGALTYGMQPIILSIPFSAAYGLAGGISVLCLRWGIRSSLPPQDP